MNTFRRFSSCLACFAIVALLAAGALGADSAAKEKELIEKLRSEAPGAEKAIACKELSVYGSAAAVPELAKLLADEKLASWSRIALEAIPGPEASEALRKASGSLEGRLLVGTLNSIGVRRDQGAVEVLTGRLKDQDADVASAAAVALGRIANDTATKSLRGSLAGATPKVRNAVAEGCILCAERLMRDGKTDEAVQIYDEVRKAEVPKQKVIEATRGAIVSRKSAGIPLLVEQLRSQDQSFFRLGLTTARELPGREVADALAAELTRLAPDRAALLLAAFADRNDPLPPAVLAAAKSGSKELRVSAIEALGSLGDVNTIGALLEMAGEGDADIAETAKAALAALPGDKVNADVVARLSKADGKALAALLDVVGRRRIETTPILVKSLDHSDVAVRGAALTALGATAKAKDVSVLIAQVVSPKNSGDTDATQKALRAACVRMPDREACAGELVEAMARAGVSTKSTLLEILGEMGGAKALATIGAAVKGGEPALQDTGSRVLGEWMTLDAAPVLLDLVKTAPSDKYQGRALRGYLRLARQFATSDRQRAEMCTSALAATARPAEQELVLGVLERHPSADGLKIAMQSAQTPALKETATRVSLAIIQKLGDKAGNANELLAKLGLDPMKVEIIKAEYGAGAKQKDVTESLKRQVSNVPLIPLPSPTYSASFGGDPAPGTAKILRVQYRINGKEGEATFPENTIVILPMPE